MQAQILQVSFTLVALMLKNIFLFQSHSYDMKNLQVFPTFYNLFVHNVCATKNNDVVD